MAFVGWLEFRRRNRRPRFGLWAGNNYERDGTSTFQVRASFFNPGHRVRLEQLYIDYPRLSLSCDYSPFTPEYVEPGSGWHVAISVELLVRDVLAVRQDKRDLQRMDDLRVVFITGDGDRIGRRLDRTGRRRLRNWLREHLQPVPGRR